jgi:hypothetical protein
MTQTKNHYSFIFAAALFVHFCILLASSSTFSISYDEALKYFDGFDYLHYLTHLSTTIFGQSNTALRLPFVLIYTLSAILMYALSGMYFQKQSDRLISTLVFMALPGVNSAALLVNPAIVVIFFTLLYIYIYKTTHKHNYLLLAICLFIDNSFAIFFLALFFYSLSKKDNTLLAVSLLLFALSMYIYGFDVGGKPRGYLLDTFGIYASIFSPLLFIYFFYSMYKIATKGEHTLYWYISFTALIFSLIFSFRQKIFIEDFAPFVVVAVPMMMKTFFHSLRVRLPRFQKGYLKGAYIVVFVLISNLVMLLVNGPIYMLLDEPQKHFAYNYHFAYELATKLKQKNINYIKTDKYLMKRLEFYGIKKGDKYKLTKIEQNSIKSSPDTISINYLDKNLITFFLSRI